MKRLENKVAVITGGAKGIGRATVEKFLQEGAKVIIADIDEAGGKVAFEALKDDTKSVDFVKVDVSDKKSVENLFNLVKVRFGRCDILVNNAGILMDSTLKKLEEEAFDKVIDINLKGVYLCTKAVSEMMLEQESGVILNAASVVAHYGNFGQTNYVASKAGLIGMSKVWTRELGKAGIRVNAVAPGFIKTEMTEGIPEKVVDMLSAKVPLGRWGNPDEVANVYCFLASDEATYVNGAVINVDGGVVI
ncbi:3-oxoacyl-ACP reductase FabG [Candidatus Neomarinimicrobiota bacterium]